MRFARHGDAAAMFFNDPPRNRQAKTCSIWLGGEEGFKEAVEIVGRNPDAVVLNDYSNKG